MAFSIVHSTSGLANGVGSITLTISSTTAGNLLIVTAEESNSTITLTPSVSAGTSQTFAIIGSSVNSGNTGLLQAWHVDNCAAGTTGIKITRSSGTGQWTATCMEVSGVATASPLDKNASSTSTGTTGTTATTTQANEFWFAVFMAASSGGTAPTMSSLSSGWTQDQTTASTQSGSNTNMRVLTAYKTVSSTGTANATCTVSGAASNGYGGIVATFGTAGAGASNPGQFFLFMGT